MLTIGIKSIHLRNWYPGTSSILNGWKSSPMTNSGTGPDKPQSRLTSRNRNEDGSAIHSASLLLVSPGRLLTGIDTGTEKWGDQNRLGANMLMQRWRQLAQHGRAEEDRLEQCLLEKCYCGPMFLKEARGIIIKLYPSANK